MISLITSLGFKVQRIKDESRGISKEHHAYPVLHCVHNTALTSFSPVTQLHSSLLTGIEQYLTSVFLASNT